MKDTPWKKRLALTKPKKSFDIVRIISQADLFPHVLPERLRTVFPALKSMQGPKHAYNISSKNFYTRTMDSAQCDGDTFL